MPIELRAATAADMPAITRIATHYVHTSVAILHSEPQPEAYYAAVLDSCQQLGLPYLIAYDTDAPATVLGYAYANAYKASKSGYRFSAELSIYCAPDTTGRGIGARLLGELLAILKTPASFLGAPYGGSYPPGVKPAQIRHLLANMSVDTEGRRGGRALQDFYEGFGFVERGRLVEIGFKFGRWIDTVELQYSFY